MTPVTYDIRPGVNNPVIVLISLKPIFSVNHAWHHQLAAANFSDRAHRQIWGPNVNNIYILSAVDKPKFMGRPPDHPWWKTGSPKSFLGCLDYFDISLRDVWVFFWVINTKFACFPFNHVPTFWELGRTLGDFAGHVGSPDSVMGRIWRLGNHLSTALHSDTWIFIKWIWIATRFRGRQIWRTGKFRHFGTEI